MRLLLLVLLPSVAQALDWFDPQQGCGRAANFAKSGKVADLPGCTGRVPKGAPEVENVLHDAKQLLLDAEDRVAKNKLDKVDALLAGAREKLAHMPPVHPELPDRWEQSLPLYQRTIATLENRMLLLPHLPQLRAAHEGAAAARPLNNAPTEGGPAQALKAAQACVTAFEGVAKLELEPPLGDWRSECQQLKSAAEPLVRAQEKAQKARRAKLRASLKGDRRKIFDQHPEALPEMAGADVWRYGKQTYTFKRNKLVSK